MSEPSPLKGPDDLADEVLGHCARQARRYAEERAAAAPDPVAEGQVRRLIRLVYHASQLPDVGRYPRFRVVLTGRPRGGGIGLLNSARGQPIDSPEALRRLAPAAAGLDSALLVQPAAPVDDGATLVAFQIADFEQFCAGPRGDASAAGLADPPELPRGALFVRADGPGDVRAVLHPSPVFHLRGGRVRRLAPYHAAVPPFADLVGGLAAGLHASLEGDPRIAAFVPNAMGFAEGLFELWAATLSTVIVGRHGGAFAIVPDAGTSCVNVKYRASAGLFAAFEGTLRHCLQATDPSGPRCMAVFRQYWQLHQAQLRRTARMIGQLAAPDGCVLLDHRLDVHGFGAKIDWPADAAFMPLETPDGRRVPDELVLHGMGTRHRSACRLAQVLPGAIVFVVSQDGNLSAVYNDAGQAFRAKDLAASPSVSELL